MNNYARLLNNLDLLKLEKMRSYLPFDKQGANLFFQLITRRYEKKSTIITTNQHFSKWGEIFGDSVIANAILDRLVHHSEIIHISGKSFRIQNKINKDEEDKLQK